MTLRLRLVLSFTLVVLVTAASVLVIFRQTSAADVRTFMGAGGMVGVDQLAGELQDYYLINGGWSGVENILPQAGGGMGAMTMALAMAGVGGAQLVRVADASGALVADTRGGALTRLSAGELAQADVLSDSSFLAAVIGSAVGLLVALWLSYRLLKPVIQLTRAASRLAQGDLGQRVDERGQDELSALGKAFNQMASTLQRAEANRRSMTADIAHELRTPIAVQRAHLEALQDGVYPLTAENLQPVLDQTGLLTRLVEDLRTLALADAGELRLERSPADLLELAGRVVERFRADADSRQVKLALAQEGREPLPMASVDPGRIEQILNNLLGNALRYTPQGGEIRLSLGVQGERLVLRIADNGPGIPEDALPHLFERFYRADRSRSRGGGGSGLGLAIARQLALAHGGDLTARNLPEGGAEFTLSLPYLPTPTGAR